MNSQTQHLLIDGPAGPLELAIDLPVTAECGVAVVAHPHPLFGGSLSNKVVQTLARAFVQEGWRTVRFNFRGVGKSAGEHDAGRGELDDLLAVIASQAATGPLCLAGFSFGAFVTSHMAKHWVNMEAITYPMWAWRSMNFLNLAVSGHDSSLFWLMILYKKDL